MFEILQTSTALKEFCNWVQEIDVTEIALDCEFVRQKTYWPNLCLIQIAAANRIVLIDPLPEAGTDPVALRKFLAPLEDVLFNNNIVKILHSARQDLEIFYHLFGQVPFPIFDTQVAAMFVGLGQSVGYQAIVEKYQHKILDKTQQHTDWAIRPLSEAQLLYAAQDVVDLRQIAGHVRQDLGAENRLSWALEEMEILSFSQTYQANGETVWQRVKTKQRLRPQQQAVLQDLCRWREGEAQRGNVNRGRIIDDRELETLVVQQPQIKADVIKIVGEKWGDVVHDLLLASYQRPRETWPARKKRYSLSPDQERQLLVIQEMVQKAADDLLLPKSVLTNNEDLSRVVAGQRADILCLQGWRRDCFGQAILDKLL